MTKFGIILIIVSAVFYFVGYNLGRQDQALSDQFTYQDKIDQAIQDTSDSILTACETRIDEILGQF